MRRMECGKSKLMRRRDFIQPSPDQLSYETRSRRSRPTSCWAASPVNQRSFGPSPVCIAISASILGPIFIFIMKSKDHIMPTRTGKNGLSCTGHWGRSQVETIPRNLWSSYGFHLLTQRKSQLADLESPSISLVGDSSLLPLQDKNRASHRT